MVQEAAAVVVAMAQGGINVRMYMASGGQLAGDLRGEVRKAAGYCEKAMTC